jgi:dipeptidyl aminopeptidase/acylaminoacyl peptidase
MRLLTAVLLTASAAAASSQFTIDQILSSPFPNSLTGNTHGKLVWTQSTGGVHNLWFAEAPAFQGHPLTHYTEDDGQEISEICFSEDGALVAYTRGEGANSKGEYPNPRHLVAGTEQTVFVVPSSGGEPQQIGKGNDPAISPDGKSLAYVNGGQVWSVALDGASKPVQLIHARGDAEELAWSPDGKLLAFTSRRVQHSFIAVYSPGGKELRYLDASVDNDGNPIWSPDSTKVAFLRIPTSQEAFDFGPRRANDMPWSIRVADVGSCKGREIWRAQPGPGSEFRELGVPGQLLWTDGNRIVFPWERTGYLHLYSVSLTNPDAVELTPGKSEVEHVALSPDRRSVAYSSNQGDIDRRHVWRVNADGGAPQRVTNSMDLEWSPAFAGSEIAYLRADTKQPARASVFTKDGVHDLDAAPLPAGFPAPSALVDPQQVIFSGADGLAIHGQLFLPHDGRSQHPAVIFFHGGSRRQMLLGWHYMFYYNQAYGFNQYLASQGYVVLSVNYRSGIGYGLDFREALNYGATGGSEFNDVIGAGLYLRSRQDVIPDKIGLWGGSYGGYLTALGLARASNLFAAGVDLHGVHEWNQEIQNFVPAYDPQKRQDLARVAFESSPLAFVDTWKSPVLLIHGDDDRNVNFRQTLMLVEALRKRNVPFEELVFPDEIHDLLLHQDWLTAYHAADEFLGRHLMPK